MQKILVVIQKNFSFLSLLLGLGLIAILFKGIALEYLTFGRPVGGDYYNALTYAVHFAKHLPFPPSGWLSFWHEGIPIIGGYPTFAFYLMSPLFRYFEPAHAMELFTIGSLLLFLLVSFLLFWEITKSSAFSFILTFGLYITRATYYQLFGEGLIVAAASQWLLPLTLFFLYRFFRTNNNKYLLLCSISTGASLLFHPAIGLLTIFFPTMTLLIVYLSQQKEKAVRKISSLTLYIIVTIASGSIGLYSMTLQMFFGLSSGACNNPQCWGLYPQHLLLWFTIFTPIITITFLSIAILVKLIKKQSMHFSLVLGAIAALFFLLLYPLAAYLHLIDQQASAIFPRRIFWAINLFSLLVAANSYRFILQSFNKKASWTISSILVIALVYLFSSYPQILRLDRAFMFNYPGTIPDNIGKFIIPKYKDLTTPSLAGNLVPEWVAKRAASEQNFRFDSLNQQVNHWWNTVFAMPAVRGYSNNPTGKNATWQYFLQVGTAENKPEDDKELIKNRTRFLLDHYAIGLYEDSGRNSSGGLLGYDSSILEDQSIIKRQENVRELSFYEIANGITSPIVSPTNGIPALVVTDDSGYETMLRTLTLTGITSQKLIPIKGPQNINNLTKNQLAQFNMLILYRFKGQSWKEIQRFIEAGGEIYIEVDAGNKSFSSTPDFFPVTKIATTEIQGQWSPQIINKTDLTENIKIENFAPFVYEGGPWRFSVSPKVDIRPWAEPILGHDNYFVLTRGIYGKGRVIISGLNLPFHIVANHNPDEVKLFTNSIQSLIEKQKLEQPTFEIQRSIPEKITIVGNNIKGIYFKENYHSGWKATVYPEGNRRMNGKQIPIYKAGLDFMYVPLLDAVNNKTQQVVLSFNGSLTIWILFIVTIVSLFVSVIYLIFPYPFLMVKHHVHHHIKHIAGRRISKWIKEDEYY